MDEVTREPTSVFNSSGISTSRLRKTLSTRDDSEIVKFTVVIFTILSNALLDKILYLFEKAKEGVGREFGVPHRQKVYLN